MKYVNIFLIIDQDYGDKLSRMTQIQAENAWKYPRNSFKKVSIKFKEYHFKNVGQFIYNINDVFKYVLENHLKLSR